MHNVNFKYIVNLLLILIIGHHCKSGLALESAKVDYANFYNADSSAAMLEIYMNFSNNDLKFVKTDSNYLAQAEIILIIYDNEGNFVKELSTDQTIVERYFNMTISRYGNNNVLFYLHLNPGNYQLHIYLTDRTTNNTKKIEKEITVRAFDEHKLTLSDIQVASLITETESKSDFVKNGRRIIPNPSRTFKSNLLHAEFYFEIYNLTQNKSDKSNSFTFSYKVVDDDKNIISEHSNKFAKPARTSAINFSVPTSILDSGEYNLQIEVIDNDSKMSATNNVEFRMEKETYGVRVVEDEEILGLLNIISTNKELKQLKESISGEKNKQALTSFLNSKDPTPGTPENEYMVEFYSRLQYVNTAFASGGRKGWQTDRGRIFLKYGPPDKIESERDTDSWAQYETWKYFSKQMEYIFIDEFGYGDYQLKNKSYSVTSK